VEFLRQQAYSARSPRLLGGGSMSLYLLDKNINTENKKNFYDLGRNLSFFSSLNDDESCGIYIQLGVSNPLLNNIVNINLPYINFSGFTTRQKDFENFFKKLVIIFNPYIGFIANSMNKQLSEDYWKDNKPAYAHWMNYYSKFTAENIGLDKIMQIDNVESLGHGYFFKMQMEPLDVNNSLHLLKQKEVTTLLGLI
jgi:hypothetical protein